MSILRVTLLLIFTECQCDVAGSKSPTCNSNGLCECKTNLITGEKCSQCIVGLVAFPNCTGTHKPTLCCPEICVFALCSQSFIGKSPHFAGVNLKLCGISSTLCFLLLPMKIMK